MANLRPFRRRMLTEQLNPWNDLMQLANMVWDKGFGPTGFAYPAIDVEDTPDAYLVKADVPGYSRGDLQIELEGNTVTITGNTIAEKETDSPDLIYQERRVGEFRRTLTLPRDIDAEHAEATFNNGVLEIRLPKAGKRGLRLSIN